MSKVIMLLDNSFLSDARVEKEAKILSQHGYKIEIMALIDSSSPKLQKTPYYTINRNINPFINRPLASSYKVNLRTYVDFLLSKEFEILHCHDFKMLLIGVEVKKRNPEIKLIYDSHEFLSGWPYYQTSKEWINRAKGRIVWNWFVKKEKKGIKYADEIITVSQSLVDEMQKRFKLKNKPVLIRNIPYVSKFNSTKYFHKYFNLPKQFKVIIHPGNLSHTEKRLKLLVKAMKEFNNICLVFLGSSRNIDVLKELVRKQKLNNKVLFHPQVPAEKVTYYCSAADFGIVHTWRPKWKSHWLSLPNKLMEISLAGLPLICTAQPEFVRFGNEFEHAVYYNGNSYGELVKAIHEAIKNYTKLKNNAMQIHKKLNWENESLKLLNLYAKIT